MWTWFILASPGASTHGAIQASNQNKAPRSIGNGNQETSMDRIALKGSERAAVPAARIVSVADQSEKMQVTVIVRRHAPQDFQQRVAAHASGRHSGAYLTRAQFANRYGATASDLAAVRAFAASYGLAVLEEHAARRTLLLSGSAAQFSKAFDVKLHRMAYPGGSYRGRVGAVTVPAELEGIIEAVLGLDDRPQAKTHFRLQTAGAKRHPKAPTPMSYQPPQVAALYAFPAGTGQGQYVGLIELGGGFVVADLDTYFASLSIAPPQVTAVSVDQATNSPTGDADGPDGEVMLDIEMVGALAPGASIAVYFAPNTDAGFLDAITTAIHETANQPDIISISWGGAESTWTAQAMTAMDEAFQDAATLGITVCVASGDSGSSDGEGSGDQVDFPASSPHVLACGGTSLRGTQTTIQSEVVWNDGSSGGASGGGVSGFFATPSWQTGLSADRKGVSSPLAMRGVPDVSGDADPDTGYAVRIDGEDTVIGGTSAVAPLWAALIARVNQSSGKSAGLVNPQLYGNPQALRDITSGNNGDFEATIGWDACTGLGSPNGTLLGGLF
jgi:kumamolisin